MKYRALKSILLTSVSIAACMYCMTSCSSKYTQIQNYGQEDDKSITLHSPFLMDTVGHIFNAQITFRKKSFSGLLFIKNTGREYRFSFVSKTGQRIWDVGVQKDDFVVHHILEPLDKKLIRNQLEKDMRLLIWDCDEAIVEKKRSMDDTNIYRLYPCDNNSDWGHLVMDKKQDRVLQFGFGSKSKVKHWSQLHYGPSGALSKITIDRSTIITLRYELSVINE